MARALIAIIAVIGLAGLLLIAVEARRGRGWRPRGEMVALGAVTNFLDTLGIGSFAPTMAWLRGRRLLPDRMIAPTMYTGHGLPAVVQSIIFLAVLGSRVDPRLLAACVAAMTAGVAIGIPLASRAALPAVRAGIAVALLVAAGFYAAANLDLLPAGGDARGLPPAAFGIAVAAHLLLGILVNFGIGHYAPSLLLLSLLGMDPRLVFPIMASAGVIAMSGIALRSIRDPAVDLRTVTGLALGGVPAVFVAAMLVRAMPLHALRWLVIVVVVAAAADLLRAITAPARPPE